MSIIRGEATIGFSNAISKTPTLPSAGLDQREIIDELTRKVENLTTLISGKADSDKIRTLLAYSDEAILIQAEDIVLAGTVTIAKIINEQNGTTTGQVAESITQIIGDKIRTGSITSNNWGQNQGTFIGLDDDTIVMGGLLNPAFVFQNGNLTISGTLTAGSIVLNKNTTLGEMVDDIADSVSSAEFDTFLDASLAAGVGDILAGDGGDFILDVGPASIYARHYLFNENGIGSGYTGDLRSGVILTGAGLAMGYNRKSDGVFVPAIAISAAGDISVQGTIIAGSVIAGSVTVDGTQIVAVRDNAATGAGHAGTSGNPHNTALTQITGDLDDISDGSTYFRSTATQNIGGTRAANAIDASFDYIRAISTQKIAVSGTNPASGIIIDNTGLRGYSASTLKFNISTTGDAWFAGDINAGAVIAGTVTADGSPVSTIKTNAETGAGHAAVVNSNPHNTSLIQISGDLDDIADGSTFFKSTSTQNIGGSRAAQALDSNFDYIRAISTQKIVVSGGTLTNGVVFDSAGLRGYSGGVLTFNINTSGTAFFKGDITGSTGTFSGNVISAGQIKATGSTAGGGGYGNFSIIAQPSGSTVEGILADTTAVAIRGFSSNNTGVVGISNSLSHYGMVAANNNGGYGISIQATRGIQRTKNTTGKLTVWDTATNTLQGEFWYEFSI